MWIIEKGVNRGERVVVEGVQKVRDGMPVKIAPATATGSM
jgi:membrane fusion protein (multidrug efflux system)